MVSDAVAHFLDVNATEHEELVGMRLEEIFPPETRAGGGGDGGVRRGAQVAAETVTLEDGRQVQISLDRIDDGQGVGATGSMGTLLTLRDTASALELEQELEVSRRLAAIGQADGGRGHEVKNPINAMVVHLELLRGSWRRRRAERAGAQRHVDILAGRDASPGPGGADAGGLFAADGAWICASRICGSGGAVVELAGAEMEENGVQVEMMCRASR